MSSTKNYNISFIKFILAVMVIFSHCFPISSGLETFDWLYNFSAGQLDFGKLSVWIFLFYSGYLIIKSLNKKSSLVYFFRNRVSKLLPPLWIVLIITVIIIGPLVTTLSVKDYFLDFSWLKYLIKNMFLLPTYNISGCFVNNQYVGNVNGSLWTLPVEFLCYIFCFISYKLHISKDKYLKYTFPIFIIVYYIVLLLFNDIYIIKTLLPVVSMFYMGMICYSYQDKIKFSNKIMILLFILFILSLKFNFLNYINIFIIPYIIMCLSFNFKSLSIFKWKMFNLSYEIYLTGFLVQQIISYLFGGYMNPYVNFILSLPIVIVCSFLLNKICDKYIYKKSKLIGGK